MKPIGAYVDECRRSSIEEFCERNRHPFLLHSVLTGSLIPTNATRGVTLDRLVLGDDFSKARSRTARQEEAYSVFELLPRNPKDRRISVGCSSTCDIQINDKSVSTLHAYLEKKDDRYLIQDNNSAAGTQVNDEVLETGVEKEIASGDRLTLGFVDLVFVMPADFHQFIRRFFGL